MLLIGAIISVQQNMNDIPQVFYGMHFRSKFGFDTTHRYDVDQLAEIFRMPYMDALIFALQWMRESQANTRILSETILFDHELSEPDRLDQEQTIRKQARRFCVLSEAFRQVLMHHSMMYMSAGFSLMSPSGVRERHSGFFRLPAEPATTELVMHSEDIVFNMWDQKLWVDHPEDEILSMQRHGTPCGIHQLILDPPTEHQSFIPVDELSTHVYSIIPVPDTYRDSVEPNCLIANKMKLVPTDLFILCNEILIRQGVHSPMQLLFWPRDDDDDDDDEDDDGAETLNFTSEIFFNLLKDTARTHWPFDDSGVSMHRKIMALTFMAVIEFQRYQGVRHILEQYLKRTYETWVNTIFCAIRSASNLHNTIGNYHLMKTAIISSMITDEYRGTSGNFRVTHPISAAFTAKAMARSFGTVKRVFEDTLQLKLPGFNVHELLSMTMVLRMFGELSRNNRRAMTYLLVCNTTNPDLELLDPREVLTPLGRRMFLEDVPDFSGEENAETTCHQHLLMVQYCRRRAAGIAMTLGIV